MDDRRHAPRAEAADGLILANFLGAEHKVANISSSGLLIFPYGGASTVGQFLQISVSVNDAGCDFAFLAEVTVVRVEQHAVAMKFHSISSHGKQQLSAYFSRKFSSNLFDVRA